ncbi:MAG: family 78 glycoside hydrolase catalytic domain [Puniceicoccaceae bacterium]
MDIYFSRITRRFTAALAATLLGCGSMALTTIATSEKETTVDWKAQWIYMEGVDRNEPGPAPYLRKEFELEAVPSSVVAHVTALGLYELYINGQRVGDGELSPGWTDYHTRVPYQTFEVSDLLREGTNTIGVMLGDGWYCGKMFINRRACYGDYPEFLLQMETPGANGRDILLTTDDSWKTATGPILMSDIYDGEIYDARLEMDGWDRSGFDDSGWESVAMRPLDADVLIEPARIRPVRRMNILSTQKFWKAPNGEWLFDLGQNMVGWAKVRLPSEEGREITIRFAEMLQQDGNLYTENYRSAKSTNIYIARGGSDLEEWEPTFTFHGFRYVGLAGLPEDAVPSADWVEGIVLHTDMDQSGEFACSNDLLNQLQSNIIWGQKGNFLEVPTDCPQRNERLGWTGDAQIFCPTASFNFDVLDFFNKWMIDVRDAQREDGSVPVIAPDGFKSSFRESPAWSDAIYLIPWEIYVRYGDIGILRDNFEAMLAWLDYQKTNSPGLVREETGYGDWLQPYPKNGDNKGDTNRSLIGTAHFAYGAGLTARIAGLIGEVEEAERLKKLAEEVRQVFVETFWLPEGKLSSDTQTAYLLALAFDLLDEEAEVQALDNLIRLIEEADNHLGTGFVGTPLLAPTLTRYGKTKLAYEIVLKETYPSWIFSIHQGATTMWERWNSYSHAEGFGNVAMNSFNHYAYGAIGQWMYETIAGLAPDPDNPGYKHFFVRPQPGGNLTWARATLRTPQGKAGSSWKLSDGKLSIEAIVPEGSTCTVVLPEGSSGEAALNGQAVAVGVAGDLQLGPGSHRIETAFN